MTKRILLYTALLLVGTTTAACADPVSAAIVSLAGLGGLGAATAIATGIVDIGLAVGFQTVSRAIGGRR